MGIRTFFKLAPPITRRTTIPQLSSVLVVRTGQAGSERGIKRFVGDTSARQVDTRSVGISFE